jgi:flagellar motor switch protein FliM
VGIPTSLIDRIGPSGVATSPANDKSLISLDAQLNASKISAADLATLEIGDLIATDHKADEPVTICIDGVPRFLGRLGALAGRKAVRIESTIENTIDAAGASE